ncbi:MAG: hypothetical protein ACFE9L_09505, partial [Candidatus Hodarchaeota archaeon]
MGVVTEYDYLAHIPTYVFKNLLNKWKKISIELKPNGLLSDENRENVINAVQDISESKIKQLQKLSENLNISEVWWQAYQIHKIKQLASLQKRRTTFTVEKDLDKNYVKIKGIFSIKELSEYAIFILIEFTSRSVSLRRKFRYIYVPSSKIILIEQKEHALELLKKEILPYISKEPDRITPKRPNARLIRNFAKPSGDSRPQIVLNYLKIKISLETSGIEGLSQIIINGDDVIRGAETLEQRHEISLKFMNSGPWVGAGTKDYRFEVRKGIQILRLEEEPLKNLATV